MCTTPCRCAARSARAARWGVPRRRRCGHRSHDTGNACPDFTRKLYGRRPTTTANRGSQYPVMDLALRLSAAALLLGLAACADTAPRTTAMGAGPACDLSVDVRGDHRCAVRHVEPAEQEQQLTNSMRSFEAQIAPASPGR